MVPAPFADAARLTVEAFEGGALAIDELPADAAPAAPDTDDAAMPRLSRATWFVIAIVVIAIVVF